MDSSAFGTVVFTAENMAALSEGIGLILSRWTAMRAGVENSWGGRDSQAKAERTVSRVFDYFVQLKTNMMCSFNECWLSDDVVALLILLVDPLDIYNGVAFDDVAAILVAGLDALRTVAEDGSVDEVTDELLDLYEDCKVQLELHGLFSFYNN